jgi:hypothetical protein
MTVRPIASADVAAVARFLHQHLNSRVSASAWSALLAPPWKSVGPNHGFQLFSGDALVGVYAAVYAERTIGQATVTVCNLAAFCVLEPHRMHGLRLVRALLKQDGVEFTDLSPSGNVIAMNERLGFKRLDTSTRLTINLPALPRRGVTVTSNPHELEASLHGEDAVAYRDHRAAAAAHHLLVRGGERYAYLIFRRDRRKRVPVFASPLFVGGDRELLRRAWPQVSAWLLSRGLLATLAERRILGFLPTSPGRLLANPRPKMYRGTHLDPQNVDYLYSELALVRW